MGAIIGAALRFRPFVAGVAGLAFAVAPVAAQAQAQSCDMLRAQLGGASGDLLGIASDYPRTHIAIVSCLMGNDTDDDRMACSAAMVVGACIGLGSEGCNDLTSRWEKVSRSYQRITARMRALGCRP